MPPDGLDQLRLPEEAVHLPVQRDLAVLQEQLLDDDLVLEMPVMRFAFPLIIGSAELAEQMFPVDRAAPVGDAAAHRVRRLHHARGGEIVIQHLLLRAQDGIGARDRKPRALSPHVDLGELLVGDEVLQHAAAMRQHVRQRVVVERLRRLGVRPTAQLHCGEPLQVQGVMGALVDQRDERKGHAPDLPADPHRHGSLAERLPHSG